MRQGAPVRKTESVWCGNGRWGEARVRKLFQALRIFDWKFLLGVGGQPCRARTGEDTALSGFHRASGKKAGGIKFSALDLKELIEEMLIVVPVAKNSCGLQCVGRVWGKVWASLCFCPADAEGALPGSLCPASPHFEPQRGPRGKLHQGLWAHRLGNRRPRPADLSVSL